MRHGGDFRESCPAAAAKPDERRPVKLISPGCPARHILAPVSRRVGRRVVPHMSSAEGVRARPTGPRSTPTEAAIAQPAALRLRQHDGAGHVRSHRLARGGDARDDRVLHDHRPDRRACARRRGGSPGDRRSGLRQPPPHARPGNHRGRHGRLALPPRHAAGDLRRPAHRQRPDRRRRHRPRREDLRAAQGALGRPRARPHADPRLVGDDLHDPRRARDRKRVREKPFGRRARRPGQGGDGRPDPREGSSRSARVS